MIKKSALTIILTTLTTLVFFGQKTDTLTFYSKSLQQNRTVYIQTPLFYKYQSDTARLPVIYLLDGQHEWFANSLKTAIEYLQYTHEVPQAIIVTIPHINRITECRIKQIRETALPLHVFITEEIEERLRAYHPNKFRLIIGHSFSASFALYSYLKSPSFYSAVIANSPLDHFEDIVKQFLDRKDTDRRKISISVGGASKYKDYYHRQEFNRLKLKYPTFFDGITTFEADQSAHNAVPIVATPSLLSKLFEAFSDRYKKIAEVNEEYQLISLPQSVSEELNKLNEASTLGSFSYGPEIPDINGLASRYLTADLSEFGIAIYEFGLRYFPKYYEFHLSLYELYLPLNPDKAKFHLQKAGELLETIEVGLPEREDLLKQVHEEKKKNNW